MTRIAQFQPYFLECNFIHGSCRKVLRYKTLITICLKENRTYFAMDEYNFYTFLYANLWYIRFLIPAFRLKTLGTREDSSIDNGLE